MLKVFIYCLLLLAINSCGENQKEKPKHENSAEFKNMMIESHQEFLKVEKKKIDKYIDTSGLNFITTGTGLRYHIIKPLNGDSIKSGDIAIVTYKLNDIEGELLYESPKNKIQEFMVNYDDVESGLHEGIQKMKVGEKAIFILPVHLGHGITGDQAAISTQTTLVYHINLVGKK